VSVVGGAGTAVARSIIHAVLGTRRGSDTIVKDLATATHGLRILEIGSGRQDRGVGAYSVAHMFDSSNEFIQSDVNPAFGHSIVDVTNMAFDAEFDLVICLYVLEHVYDVQAAIAGMHASVRPGGRVIVAVPHVYPYHDEPIDFWRFTSYGLTRLFERFSQVEVKSCGLRRFPKGLAVIATR
jgi:SAM-dependent methyltransferase